MMPFGAGHAMAGRAMAVLLMVLASAQQAFPMTQERDAAVLLLLKFQSLSAATEQQRAAAQGIAGPLFESWREGTDPCLDGWAGVACKPSPSNSSVLRVTELSIVGNQENYLRGILLSDLSSLAMLETIDFSRNQISGEIPESYAALRELRALNVSHNELDGSLPRFLGANVLLEVVDLNTNRMHGQLPEEWCWSSFSVVLHHNLNLCGGAPECPDSSPYPTIAGGLEATQLVAPGQTQDWICDDTKPLCEAPQCSVEVAQFTTRTDRIDFNFNDFYDDESGISGYEVSLASPSMDGVEIVPWEEFKGQIKKRNGIKSLQYFGSIQLENLVLQQGETYVVRVRAYNNAGRGLSTMQESNPTTVSLLRPNPGIVYNSGDCTNLQSTTVTSHIKTCWSGFTDDVAGLAGFWAQIVDIDFKRTYEPFWVDASEQGNPVILVQELTVNSTYFVQVWARNNAGVDSEKVASPELRIEEMVIALGGQEITQSEALLAAIIAVSIILFVAMVLVFCFLQRRYQMNQMEHTRHADHQIMVKTLISSLQEVAGDEGLSGSTVRFCKELAFVTTDLMDSTKMAAADVEGFTQVQDIHDSIMREAISRFSGYEINTEGDAFLMAFRDVFDAVKFCMHVQYRLLEVLWSRSVLKLPSCKTVYGPDGEIMFKGPRVRMGIHWAQKGTFNQRLHPLTKHRIFAGPGWRIAQEIGDAAGGGQVLITHAAWNVIRQQMSKADYPVVQQIGLFKFELINNPIWVYEVKELLSQPLHRTFGNPRGIQMVESGSNLNITPPPVKTTEGETEEQARISKISVVALVLKPPGDGADMDLPEAMSLFLYEQVAIQVMQFRGYIFRVNKKRGYFLVAFADTLDAVRFCHAFQLIVMFIPWPPEADQFSMPQEIGPDGRYVYNGPRLAMAINEQPEFQAITLPNNHPHREDAVDYAGPCVDNAIELATVVHGGQVVLTQHAWIAVQDHIPGQAQALSLGVHRISKRQKENTMLMQVMPGVLARRQFPQLTTYECSEPGYLSSPDPAKEMAIVFVKVDKPAGVKTDEHRALHTRTDIELGQKGRRKTAEGSPSAELLQCFTTYLESGDGEPESFQSADEMLTRILRENAGITPFGSTADMPFLPEEAGLRNSPVDMLRSSGSGSTSGLDSHGGQVLRAYERGIYLFENQLRDALKRFNGYECKEPEPGKFTLAFSCLEDAIMWGTTLQEELLHLDWPDELLALDECAAVHTVNMAIRPTRAPDAKSPNIAQGDKVSPDADVSSSSVQSALSACMKQWKNAGQQRQLVQRGLKVQMGCAYGRVASRKPLNTGRADYFGNLPNTAARVMSLAKPGQFLIEGSAPMPTELFTSRGGSRHSVDSSGAFSISIGSSMHGKAVAPPLNGSAISNLSEDKATGEFRRTAQLQQFGYFLLKGLDEPKLMLQASTPLLSNRTFVASNRVDPSSVLNTSSRGGSNAFKLFSGKGGETKRPSGAELMVERSLVTPRQLSNLSMGRLPSVGSQGSGSSANGGGNPYGRKPNPNIYSQFVERQQQERRASRRAYSMTGSNAFSSGKALARRSNSGVLATVPSIPSSSASGGSGHVSFGGSRQGSGQYVLQLGKQAKPHPKSLTSSVPTSSGVRSRGGEGATILPTSNDGVAKRVAKPMKRATLTAQTMPSRKAGADWV